jgi:hypothetical protein
MGPCTDSGNTHVARVGNHRRSRFEGNPSAKWFASQDRDVGHRDVAGLRRLPIFLSPYCPSSADLSAKVA